MLSLIDIISGLKIIVLAAVVFVWFIRYDNIVKEFKEYQYPNWLRDLVGILKITCVLLIQLENVNLMKLGCIGLAALMAAAVLTHLKVKNPIGKMLPSLTLLTCSILLFIYS